MPRRRWKLRVQDILEAVIRVIGYTDEMEYQDFVKDRRTVDAAIRNLIIIGEAAARVPDDDGRRKPSATRSGAPAQDVAEAFMPPYHNGGRQTFMEGESLPLCDDDGNLKVSATRSGGPAQNVAETFRSPNDKY